MSSLYASDFEISDIMSIFALSLIIGLIAFLLLCHYAAIVHERTA